MSAYAAYDIRIDLKAGIFAARAGQHEHARACFLRVLERQPHNQDALLWLSTVLPSPRHALVCLEQLLAINPLHEIARTYHARLVKVLAAAFEPEGGASQRGTSPLKRGRLGEQLLTAGWITPRQLETALAIQARLAWSRRPQPLGDILISLRYVNPDQVELALAVQRYFS